MAHDKNLNVHMYDKACGCAYCVGYEKQLQKIVWDSEMDYRKKVYVTAVTRGHDSKFEKIIQ